MYSTDSDMYYDIYFKDGYRKSFKFNGGNLVYKNSFYELDNNDVFALSTSNEIDCDTGKINHNLIKNNILDKYNLYYYEIDNAYININNEKIDLANALLNNEIDIDDIISKMEYNVSYYDGGTILYKNTNVFDEDFELLKCKTLDGNNDIYIGPSKMGYRSNFCKNDNQTFTKTYTIKEVRDYKEPQYEDEDIVSYGKSIKVLLSGYDNKDVYVIMNNFWDELEINKTYEFEFMPNNNLKLVDSVESIFKNCIIVGAKETNKTESSQINDLVR